MAGFGAAWWLVALLSIPLIRWLHRWQAPLVNRPVSAVFLWDAADSVGAGGAKIPKPDRAWRLRALIAGCLVLALAQPWWQRGSAPVTVWIDDSLSMSTIEQGDTRLAAGFRQLEIALRASRGGKVTLRSLSNPAHAMNIDQPGALDSERWLTTSRGEPDPPPAVLMTPDHTHWLVTDGASDRVVDWVRSAPLDIVVSVGSLTENVAITRLAVRPAVGTPGAAHVLVSVSNPGASEASREVRLVSGGRTLANRSLTLLPGETRHWNATLQLDDGGLSALLFPGDAVSTDDRLALDAPAIARVPTLLGDDCPASLRSAIEVHPLLRRIAGDEAAQFQVSCSDAPRQAPAMVRVTIGVPEQVDATPEWQPGAGRLQELNLAEAWIAASEWHNSGDDAFEALLVAADKPLVLRRTGSPAEVRTVIDLSHPVLTKQPEYAALVAGLVDLATGRPLLDSVTTSAAKPSESRITPTALHVRDGRSVTPGTARLSLTGLFLAIAGALIAADMMLLWRAQARAGRA